MKKIFNFACIALAIVALAACTPKQKAEKVTLANEVDSVSYAFGMTQGEFIQNYILSEKDDNYKNTFIKSFRENFKEATQQEEFENQVLTFGYQVGQDLKKGFFSGDSTFTLDKKVLVDNIRKGMNGEFSEEEIAAFNQQFQRLMMDQSARSAEQLDSMNVAFGALNGNSMKNYIDFIANDSCTFDPKALAEKNFNQGLKKASNNNYEAVLQGKAIAGQLFGMLQQMPNIQIEDFTANIDMVKAGIINYLVNDESIMKAEDAQSFYTTYAEEKRKAKLEFQFAENRTAGEQFLAENKEKPGVITTESGLQYQVVKMGKGETPKTTDRVKVHYHGTLIDGTVFDSSVDRGEPAEFGVTQVIAGWTEVLQLMPVGSKFKVFIPQELAYGDRDMGTIKPFSTLIFDIELLEILGDAKQDAMNIIK